MKKLFSVLLALSMIFLISACDKKEEETVAGSGVLINKFEETFAEESTVKFVEKEIDGGYVYEFEEYDDIYVCRADKGKNIYNVEVTISDVDIDVLKDSKSLRSSSESEWQHKFSLRMLKTVECPATVAGISIAIGGDILTDAMIDEFYQIFDGSGKELKLNDEWVVTVSLDEQKETATIMAQWSK